MLKLAKKEASRARGQTGAKEKLRIRLDAAVDGLQPSVIEFAEAVVALAKHAAAYSRVASHVEKERATYTSNIEELEGEIEGHARSESELREEYDQLTQSELGGIGSLADE